MRAPIHVAITRTVKPGCEEAFEKAIRTFFADSLKETGTLGAQLLLPLPGSQNRTYGILRSFASVQDRDAFYQSESFRQWDQAVKPLVEEDYSRRELTGLEAFFTDPHLIVRPPLWKMALLTWLGVWVTVWVVSNLVGPWLAGLPSWLATGVISLIVVSILTWGVMPILTRLARPWLIPSAPSHSEERNGP
jgi:antibiotic biosynthesis monooxygenase (ABM) superfamily enzyme